MKKNKINEKGFTTIDVGIAMIVVIIFVTIMSSMIYSVYLSSTEAKRTAMALNYAVDIFEEIGLESYSSITSDGILRNLENLTVTEINTQTSGNTEIATGKIGTYDIRLEMSKPYADGTIKLFKLNITYPVSTKNTETIDLQRIKTISKS